MSHLPSSDDESHTMSLSARLSRSRLEEEMVILAAVREGASSMELLQNRTNLPWRVLSDTAGSLLQAGFLTVEDGNQIPKLNLKTKGLELIERYRGVLNRIATARAVIELESP